MFAISILSSFVLALAPLAPADDEVLAAQLPSYPLETCLVSDEPLTGDEEMKPVDKVVDGRLVRFCCKGCVKEFDKDQASFFKKLDRAVVAAQRGDYPLATCPVSGNELGDDAIDAVHGTRLVRLCCNDCREGLEKDPAKVMKVVDAAYIEAQLADYPLTTCPYSGEALEEGSPNVLYGTQLVRVCCNRCAKMVAKDPQVALGKLAEARSGAAEPAAADGAEGEGR